MSDSYIRDKEKSIKVKSKSVRVEPTTELVGFRKSGSGKSNKWLEMLEKAKDEEVPKRL